MPTSQQMQNALRQRKEQVATCVRCKEEKPWDAFAKSPSRRPFGLASNCLECDRLRKAKQQTSKYWADPEKGRKISRQKRLQNNFGISIEDYERMFTEQQGLCAICGNPETYVHHSTRNIARLAIDHDHITGKVRALLCSNCNKGLGCFKDSPAVLEKAIQYLKDHSKEAANVGENSTLP